jgi:hypothetical protein
VLKSKTLEPQKEFDGAGLMADNSNYSGILPENGVLNSLHLEELGCREEAGFRASYFLDLPINY